MFASASGSPDSQAVCALVAGRRHWLTLPIVVLTWGMPKPHSTTPNRTTAITRFMNGPPDMITTRFQTGSL